LQKRIRSIPKSINVYTLLRMVQTMVYRPESMKLVEFDIIHRSISQLKKGFAWARQENISMGAVEQEAENVLMEIEDLILQDSSGELDLRRELFRKHGIDYRKFCHWPEVYKPEDFIRAQEELKKTMESNPEEYPKGSIK